MANTITGTLEKLLASSIPLQTPALPRIPTFATILPMDTVEVGHKTHIPIITAAQAVVENPTTFENATDTLGNGEATQVRLSAQFGLANPELVKSLPLRIILATHLTMIQKAILAKVYGLLFDANYGTSVTVSAAAYAKANFQTGLTAVPNRTAFVLDTGHWAKTERDWFPPGSEGTLQEGSVWTGAEANVVGFVARPEAIALAVGYPRNDSDEIQTRMITLPIGLDVQLSTSFQRSGRAWYASLDIVLAPCIGQSAALRLIKSA